MNGSRDTAEASLARIVVPAQTEIVHPPDLWLVSDSDVDADGVEVLEAVVKGNRCESTVCKSRAGGDGDGLGGDCGGVAGALVQAETSEAEDARRAARITAEGCTIHIEAKAACEAVVAIANVTRITIFSSVRTSHGVSAIDIEVGNELCEERLGRWQVWSSWRRNYDPSIGEIELVIRIEDRLGFNVVGIRVGDTQRGDVIKLMEVSCLHRSWLLDDLQSK